MNLQQLIEKNRSYRRFQENYKIEQNTLLGLIDLARLSASAANIQPLKYSTSCDTDRNQLIFPSLGWAGYLNSWNGPEKEERPSAYIIILGDTQLSNSFTFDAGIAAQSILLGATELGLGGCMIGSLKRDQLRKSLAIDTRYEILLVLALGKPVEEVLIEKMPADGNVKYWRGKDKVHHVPKRELKEIIIN